MHFFMQQDVCCWSATW